MYAALTYGDAVRLDPSDLDSRFKQGFSYFKASEWGKSASSWEDLLRYDPKNANVTLLLPQVYYILAVEYNRSGESGLGQTAFRNALSINKNSNLWLPGAMKTLMAMTLSEKALMLFTIIIMISAMKFWIKQFFNFLNIPVFT